MNIKTAEKYPLLKDFDFITGMSGRAGSGILLVPQKHIYVPKEYGFGYLHLVPYLQQPFNEGEKMPVSDLVRELREEGEISLGSDLILSEGDIPFLHRVLNRFRKHEIVTLEKIVGREDCISSKDILSAGENYDKTRVLKLEGYSQGSGERLGLGFPFPSFPLR